MVRLPYLQAIVRRKITYTSRSQNASYLAQNSPGVRDVLINVGPNDHIKHAISESQIHAVDKSKIQVCLLKILRCKIHSATINVCPYDLPKMIRKIISN